MADYNFKNDKQKGSGEDMENKDQQQTNESNTVQDVDATNTKQEVNEQQEEEYNNMPTSQKETEQKIQKFVDISSIKREKNSLNSISDFDVIVNLDFVGHIGMSDLIVPTALLYTLLRRISQGLDTAVAIIEPLDSYEIEDMIEKIAYSSIAESDNNIIKKLTKRLINEYCSIGFFSKRELNEFMEYISVEKPNLASSIIKDQVSNGFSQAVLDSLSENAPKKELRDPIAQYDDSSRINSGDNDEQISTGIESKEESKNDQV